MDEQTNKKIAELKRNPPNRVLPVLLLTLALAGVFCYRVASTDPNWEAAESAVAPQTAATAPKKAATPAPKALTAVTAQPVEVPPSRAADETPPAPVTTSAPVERPPAETALAGRDALETYLNRHLGQKVPFLYKGEKHMVTLAAFSDETVTIKRKKSFTMKLTELAPEQLRLWR